MMQTLTTTHLSLNEFHDALASAKQGATIVYATGEMSRDLELGRTRETQILREQERLKDGLVRPDLLVMEEIPQWRELNAVRDMAYRAYERKEVCLTQRRIQTNCFEYRATKR